MYTTLLNGEVSYDKRYNTATATQAVKNTAELPVEQHKNVLLRVITTLQEREKATSELTRIYSDQLNSEIANELQELANQVQEKHAEMSIKIKRVL